MLSSRAEERQANTVPPCESGRSKGIEGIRPEVYPEEGWKPEEDVELVPLDPDKPERTARIGSRLSQEEKAELAAFLQNNKGVFAWSPSDMPGIDPQIICHRLHVNPAIKPVAQKRRNFAPERVAIIEAEIDKLLATDFIEEVSYAEWLANVLIDSTSGNQLLSFMDAYSGYNQIMMHEDDRAKTSFIIERGTYCYKVMPFGLKNAGATYQRLVNKIFKEQIGKTMDVYVDDMLVKAPERVDHIKNLAEAFSLLRKYNMKLNPSKCTFGVSSGRFLGYLVTQRGIEAHPNQIKAILNMKSPATTKEIQSLTGRAAALNRFLSRSTDKCRPFFKALKKGHKDKWDDECEVAFQNLKTYLTSPPLLSKPIPGEDLYIYLAKSWGHNIRPDASQRLMKWAIELSQYDLLYRPKTAIKAQALADFVVEFTPTAKEEKMVMKNKEKADDTSPTDSNLPNDMWQLHVDGASNHKGAGAGVVIITPDGTLLEQAITLGFSASNNEAEYEALLAGLRLAKELVDQETSHLLGLPTDHESSLGRVHGKASKNGPRPRQSPRTFERIPYFYHPTSSTGERT
ncbi:unnamed protein product, partial [Prunus brigantina]